jgi:dTDP-4-dehydrorhamnose 3,5-epimerase
MIFRQTVLPEVWLIEPQVLEDSRGMFMETWESRKFAAAGLTVSFVQDNHSSSRRSVLRGLHYQLRQPQGKLVRVVSGEVFDVAVDLRRSSPTFGVWVGEILSASNKRMLWIPPGFAHGFMALSDHAQFVYKCTDFYDRASERTLRWDDPDVGIDWPIPGGMEPILSDKDRAGASLKEAECFP